MTIYLTDNPIVKKNIPGSILLYQIYNWRVIYDKDNKDIDLDIFKITNSFKRKQYKEAINHHNRIIGVVAKSNYKLLYEITSIKKKRKEIFFWENFPKRKKEAFDKKHLEFEFNKYLQRSYFSRVVYDKLAAFNMQRIEQFLIYIALYMYKIEKKELNYSFDTDVLINSILIEREEFWYAIDKLIYHSRKLDIKDPFVGEFDFLNENNSLFKIHNKNKNLKKTETTKVFLYILNKLKNIVPYVDILKTLRYLEKNELIDLKTASVFQKMKKNEVIEASQLLEVERWNLLYETKDFSLNMFPSLSFISEIQYKCPECGSTELKSSPLNFFCSDIDCKFKVKRTISPVGEIKNIAEKDLRRMLKFGHTIIKNKFGGYNRFYLKKIKDRYVIYPDIQSNNINPDKDSK